MNNIKDKRNILVVAGEPSGDKAAAKVIARINKSADGEFWGIGGFFMKKEGVNLLTDISNFASMGILDNLMNFSKWGSAWCKLREIIEIKKPRAALLVDSPEINLPLARILKQNNIRVFYYIAPQVWAWRSSRINLLRERTDFLGLVLPFEKAIFDQARVKSEYVGHPIVDEPHPLPPLKVKNMLGIPQTNQTVCLLPGSRKKEVDRIAPVMLDAVSNLRAPELSFVFAPGKNTANRELISKAKNIGAIIKPPQLSTIDILAASNTAIVTSGTATLEAAWTGTPMTVVYKTDAASAFIAKRFLNLPFIGLPNWILHYLPQTHGRASLHSTDTPLIVPEIVQDDLTAENLTNAIKKMLNKKEQKRQRTELKKIKNYLGKSSPSKNMASKLVNYLNK